MDSRSHHKSDLYLFLGYLLTGLALVFNPITVPWIRELGYYPSMAHGFMHSNDLDIGLPLGACTFCMVIGILILRHPLSIRRLLNNSAKFNIFLLLLSLFFLLTTNALLPGFLNNLRIFYVICILFLLTNTLYMVVVQKRSRPVSAIWKNVALVVYSLVLVLLILEAVFMKFEKPHRFNGNLASRAWFMNNWRLNAEGYRDVPMEGTEKKKKLMVLGDSFVSGHGVEDPEDRFSNRLQQKLEKDFRVYNLGVGGSDVADGYQRLLKFPETPDLLIYSWYVNDIEHDGEKGGLQIAGAKSYADLVAPVRYLVRRSYLLNYLYWRYPHPDELFDYRGFLEDCFNSPKVMDIHFGQLDSLRLYAAQREIPFAAVVFPFLEDIEGTQFATSPIVGYFDAHQIPVLDMGKVLRAYPAESLVVNQNDGHPSPFSHQLVADRLHALMQRNGMLNP